MSSGQYVSWVDDGTAAKVSSHPRDAHQPRKFAWHGIFATDHACQSQIRRSFTTGYIRNCRKNIQIVYTTLRIRFSARLTPAFQRFTVGVSNSYNLTSLKIPFADQLRSGDSYGRIYSPELNSVANFLSWIAESSLVSGKKTCFILFYGNRKKVIAEPNARYFAHCFLIFFVFLRTLAPRSLIDFRFLTPEVMHIWHRWKTTKT